MIEETDRDALLRISVEKASLESGLAGFVLGVIMTVMIVFFVLMVVGSK